MFSVLGTVLGLILIITALISLQVRNLIAAVVTLTAFSSILALIYLLLGAIDVALTEAVVGAGITGVLFIIAILRTSDRSTDGKKHL